MYCSKMFLILIISSLIHCVFTFTFCSLFFFLINCDIQIEINITSTSSKEFSYYLFKEIDVFKNYVLHLCKIITLLILKRKHDCALLKKSIKILVTKKSLKNSAVLVIFTNQNHRFKCTLDFLQVMLLFFITAFTL